MKPLFPLLFMLLLAGCSGNGFVSGQVSNSGQPVKTGRIEFVPVDGKTASAAAKIIDGQYSVETPPGEKIVKIFCFEETGKVTPKGYEGMEIAEYKQVFPQNLNVKSDLRYTVKQGRQKYNYPQ